MKLSTALHQPAERVRSGLRAVALFAAIAIAGLVLRVLALEARGPIKVYDLGHPFSKSRTLYRVTGPAP